MSRGPGTEHEYSIAEPVFSYDLFGRDFSNQVCRRLAMITVHPMSESRRSFSDRR